MTVDQRTCASAQRPDEPFGLGEREGDPGVTKRANGGEARNAFAQQHADTPSSRCAEGEATVDEQPSGPMALYQR